VVVKVGADPASVHYKQKVVQLTLFSSGIRPAIDDYLALEAAKVRDYGDYWSASSAGYCQRKLIFERLGVPPVTKEGDERKTRVFEAGHIFHEWIQRITKEAGLSIIQELELQDEELMVRGHIDDLVLVGDKLISLRLQDTAQQRLYMAERQTSQLFSPYAGRDLYVYAQQRGGATRINAHFAGITVRP
jgi:hypothetical protein